MQAYRVTFISLCMFGGVHCANRSGGSSNLPQIPPAEEPPSTDESMLTPDAGAERDRRGGETKPDDNGQR